MREPIWTILVPTIPRRAAMFGQLARELLRQVEPYAGAVTIQAYLNEGKPSLGEIRDRMIGEATSEFVSFVDDDDEVAPHYVDSILAAIMTSRGGLDHVGFKVEMTKNGVLHGGSPGDAGAGIVDHSLAWGHWGVTNGGMLFRDFTHIDPIRREVAEAGRFAAAAPGEPEDRAWVAQIRHLFRRPSGFLESYVDDVLYYYRWVPAASAWDGAPGSEVTDLRCCPCDLYADLKDSPYLTWNKESM